MDHAAHAAEAARPDGATPAQTSGFIPAPVDGQATAKPEVCATAPPAPSRRRHAAETQRLYAADWAAFAAWCRAAGLAALPALPTTVAAHLGSLSATLKPGALARRAAAIAGTATGRPERTPPCARCSAPRAAPG